MNVVTWARALTIVVMLCTAGCAGISRENGSALGTAGQTAAQALADQSDAARKTLDALPEWWGVRDALVCSNIAAGPLRDTCLQNVRTQITDPSKSRELLKSQKQLSEVMAKRTTAASALRDGYRAFVNLAAYDAGPETEAAVKCAVSAVNDLTKAAATIAPQGVALAAISSTFTTAASKGLGFIAAARHEHLMLLASQDLHSATDAMIKAVGVERDKAAAESLYATLRMEADTLYSAFVQSGLVAPKDALKPLLGQVAPGVELVKDAPAANADVIRTAAVISLTQQSRRQQAAVVSSYDAALAALQELSDQHMKLEKGLGLDLSGILHWVKRTEALLKDIK